MHPIESLAALGQSVWLDLLAPGALANGELERMIGEHNVRGVTSNATLFPEAIRSSSVYERLVGGPSLAGGDASIVARVWVHDATLACDALRPVYERERSADGFASIGMNPSFAEDTGAQVEEAIRLWSAVDRPNLMVKLPGTRPALPAIQSCIAHGINVDVTLLFSVSRYREVVEAFLQGLERRARANQPLDRVASVASFDLARVDTKVDRLLDAMPNALRGAAGGLRGQIAIANAKIAYEELQRILSSDRWRSLAAKGAKPQRLLWASTEPQDPLYPATYYVDALVGPGTVLTMTLETLSAYLGHGEPEVRVTKDRDMAHRQMLELVRLQIDFASLTEQLESECLAAASESFQKALDAIARKRKGVAA